MTQQGKKTWDPEFDVRILMFSGDGVMIILWWHSDGTCFVCIFEGRNYGNNRFSSGKFGLAALNCSQITARALLQSGEEDRPMMQVD